MVVTVPAVALQLGWCEGGGSPLSSSSGMLESHPSEGTQSVVSYFSCPGLRRRFLRESDGRPSHQLCDLRLECGTPTLGAWVSPVICNLPILQAEVTLASVAFPDPGLNGEMLLFSHWMVDFPGGSDGKESACNAWDSGSIPELGRSLGGEHGNPLQYSYLENSVDRGAWRATVHEVAESDMTELTQKWQPSADVK